MVHLIKPNKQEVEEYSSPFVQPDHPDLGARKKEDVYIPTQGTDRVRSREEILREPFECFSCGEGVMQPDGMKSENSFRLERAMRWNQMNFSSFEADRVYRCSDCGAEFYSHEMDTALHSMISKSKDIRAIAALCNPAVGQPWAAKSGFTTETCPLNQRPCLRELYEACPHLGNDILKDDIDSLISMNLPIIGEK